MRWMPWQWDFTGERWAGCWMPTSGRSSGSSPGACFDTISHDWLMRFLEHRIGDQRILRLIGKWLKAGVLEDDRWTEGTIGTPQGAVISPLLANVYLHYVYDLWVQQWRERCAHGDMIVVRYADDTIVGFEHEADAQCFLDDLGDRLAKFELELHPE